MYCPYCHAEYTANLPCFCQPPIQEKDTGVQTLSSLPPQHPVAVSSNTGAKVD